jgi:hypothetical protein
MDGVTAWILFAFAIGTGVFLYGYFVLARPEDRKPGRKK